MDGESENIMPDTVAKLRVVLVGTTHPGNIGASARAMKAMGLDDLVLVAPKDGIFPSAEATARAVSATDILDSARVFASLRDAVADCCLVVGTTARERHIGPPVVTPREFCAHAAERAAGRQAALVFGRESRGLTNDEVNLCQLLVRIPTQVEFASLNLGAAVQIMAYEWILTRPEAALAGQDNPRERPATSSELEGYFEHLAQLVQRIGFFAKKNPDLLMRRLRRLYHRAQLDINEINILRGILAQVDKALERRNSGAG